MPELSCRRKPTLVEFSEAGNRALRCKFTNAAIQNVSISQAGASPFGMLNQLLLMAEATRPNLCPR